MRIVSLDKLLEITTTHNKVGRKKTMVGKDLVPHITQYSRISLLPTEVVEEHAHESMYEIMYIDHGQGIFKVDGKEFSVKKGDCVIVSPREKHEVKVLGKTDLVMFITGVTV